MMIKLLQKALKNQTQQILVKPKVISQGTKFVLFQRLKKKQNGIVLTSLLLILNTRNAFCYQICHQCFYSIRSVCYYQLSLRNILNNKSNNSNI